MDGKLDGHEYQSLDEFTNEFVNAVTIIEDIFGVEHELYRLTCHLVS